MKVSQPLFHGIIKIKTCKNKYILVVNIYHPKSIAYVNIKYFNQTISNIFSKIKFDPNFKNLNEIILVGGMNINLSNHTNHIITLQQG